jgi:hypothetical protein
MAFVMNQTTEETRANWDNLSEAERKQLEERERFLANFSERKLRASSQLPDIESTSFKLRWDFAETELGSETLLMSGDKVVFREPALFEGYERFIEVAEILRARYGTALRDLVPTKGSEIYLYGDRSTSPDTVAKARRRIFFSRTKN